MSLKRSVKDSKGFVEVDDGVHVGTIIDVSEGVSRRGYDVIQVRIAVEDEDGGEPKYTYVDNDGETQLCTVFTAFNDNVSTKSDLGGLLRRLGIDIKPDDELDLEDLKGIKVSFQTSTREIEDEEADGGKREVVNVLRESIKVHVEEED